MKQLFTKWLVKIKELLKKVKTRKPKEEDTEETK